MRTSRRSLFWAALLVGPSLLARENEARADLFGGDVAVLSGILTQSIATVSNLVQMLNSLQSQIAMMRTMLSHLSVSSFSDVMRTIRSSQLAYNVLAGHVRSIEYTINSVNQRYHQIFPDDVSMAKPAEMRATAAGWHQETLGAAQVAQRSQATLSTIQSNTDQATAFLAKAQKKRDYYYRSVKGRRLFKLDLGPVALSFIGMSSEADHRFLDRAVASRPAEDFALAILEHRNTGGSAPPAIP